MDDKKDYYKTQKDLNSKSQNVNSCDKMIPWILISIALAAIVLAILGILIMKKKKWKKEVDYRNYFTMGAIWVLVGIVFFIIFENIIGGWFLLMGLVYLSIGLKNKDKWGKPQKVSPKSQQMLMIGVLIGIIVLVIGILLYELMV